MRYQLFATLPALPSSDEKPVASGLMVLAVARPIAASFW
jgi:hypothetical protein